MDQPDRKKLMGLTLVALALSAMALAVARSESLTPVPTDVTIVLTVVDERDEPIPNAAVTWSEGSLAANSLGEVEVHVAAPELVIVEASGFIPEPVVLVPEVRELTVRLLDRVGPTGERVVLHFGGDFMLGRRYQDPTRSRTALALTEKDARDLMANVAPLFLAADLQVVNFESVLGLYDPDLAYQGKRYLIQTPMFGVEALRALGVDLVTLGNNHLYDWLDPGIDETMAGFDSAGIQYAGVGLADGTRLPLAVVDVLALRVAVLSYSSIDGDIVNEFLPTASSPVPAVIEPENVWMWEPRVFGYGEPGDAGYLPEAGRRAGTVYRAFTAAEAELDEAGEAAMWTALIGTYPELQDWVARRGHGGALPVLSEHFTSDIAAARELGADLVVVQLHGGTQFAEVSAQFHRDASRRAIDAGADLVVNHHPHVLQGFEWHEGKLIAHSLGNTVFDQDFLETIDGAVLRTVFEGSTLIRAQLHPTALIDYEPVAVGGDAAERILRNVLSSSLSETVMDRTERTRIVVRRPDNDPGRPAGVRLVNGVGIIVADPGAGVDVTIDPGLHLLDRPGVVRLDGERVEIGRDLLGWGSPRDVVADGIQIGGHLWRADEQLRYDRDEGWVFSVTSETAETLRPVLRVPLEQHRVHTFEDVPEPLDPAPVYSVVLDARGENEPKGVIQVSLFRFDDSNPTVDPLDQQLDTIEVPFQVDAEWAVRWIRLPALDPEATMVRVRILVEDSRRSPAVLHVRDVRFLEWRDASLLPPDWYPVDALRATEQVTVTILAP